MFSLKRKKRKIFF